MRWAAITLLTLGIIAATVAADDSARILTIDHYVKVVSTVPAISGQPAEIYVRERARAGTVFRAQGMGDKAVLFVHGAGTPGAVAFDAPRTDFSWMEYLANAGFDVFAMDFTGYGRSTRPHVMNDPCNLSSEQQSAVGAKPCAAAYKRSLTTIGSDWDDLNAVVDYIRALRHVERVSLIAWSLGGPRSGGFAARYPAKVHKLILLAPAYNRTAPLNAPDPAREAVAFNKQSREDFFANWDRQVGCADQYDRATADAVWSAMLESDPVGATWGPGVRRAPNTMTWGWNAEVVGKTQTPTLIVAGAHDKQVSPDRVRELFTDLGAKEKMLIDLGCASHNAMWEKNHTLLFKASLDWLTSGTVTGAKEGVVRLGY
jgi:pimeloyl-ACP methyl ester carboxylesterase